MKMEMWWQAELLVVSFMKYVLLFFCFIFVFQVDAQRNPAWAVPIESNVIRNFHKVDEGIYRCAQPNKAGFSVLSEMGISEVINLRSFQTDRKYAKQNNLTFYSIKLQAENLNYAKIVTILKLIQNKQGSIVIHCKHGSDRTGLIIALYRIVFQDWSKEDAINELLHGNYNFHSIYSNIPKFIQNIDVEKLKKELSTLSDGNFFINRLNCLSNSCIVSTLYFIK